MEYGTCFKTELELIEQALKRTLRGREARPLSIHKAMQYAVFTGGKRFRPVLVLAACKACGGKIKDALPAACAIELIHAYSLVHDDLPALDNDDTRRGKPACHKKFGEAAAILAGDGLLTLAFEVLSEMKPAAKAAGIVREVSTAVGARGMIAGQVEDIEAAGKRLAFKTHDFICANKTGALIRVSVVAGAMVAGASSGAISAVTRYGSSLGLAFQVVDDLLDGDGYCRFMSREKVIRKARRLITRAKREAGKLGPKAHRLVYLADFLGSRIPL